MKIHLIMPMGGAGSRFNDVGINTPKPLIEIHNEPFLYWATESISKYIDIEDITYVVLKKHVDENGIDKVIKRYYPHASIVVLEDILPGAVYTCIEGVNKISDNLPVVFNDCDHMFRSKQLANRLKEQFEPNICGGLVTFKSNKAQYSYVKYDYLGKVTGTVEKQVVSEDAICGAYVFKDASTFLKGAYKYIEECPYNECFMSGVYNVLFEMGYDIESYSLDYHVEFGTPAEYEEAKDSDLFIK